MEASTMFSPADEHSSTPASAASPRLSPDKQGDMVGGSSGDASPYDSDAPSSAVVSVGSDAPATRLPKAGQGLASYIREHKTMLQALAALLVSFFACFVGVTMPNAFLATEVGKGPAAWVGVLYSMQPVGVAVGSLLASPWHARWGNQHMMASGFGIAGVALILTAVVVPVLGMNVPAVAALRVVAGLGGGLSDVSILNSYQVLFPEHLGQVLGVSEGCIGAGAAVGPALGGMLYDLQGWTLPFVMLGLPYLMLMYVAPAFVGRAAAYRAEEPAAAEGAEVVVGEDDEVDEDRRSPQESAVLAVGVWASCHVMGSLSPVLAERLPEAYGFSQTGVGLVLGWSGATYLASALVFGRRLDRGGAKQRCDMAVRSLLYPGFGGLVVSCVLIGPVVPMKLPASVELASIIIGYTIMSVSEAFVLVGGMAALSSTAASAPQASSIFNLAINTGYGTGPVVLQAIVSATSQRTGLLVSTIFSLVYLITAHCFYRVVRPGTARQGDASSPATAGSAGSEQEAVELLVTQAESGESIPADAEL
eukprot:Rhum_TRINITY_DN14729_c3_g1::Rhum_TRINITY_DN14729_c3_g1_i1::g.111816::m.111816